MYATPKESDPKESDPAEGGQNEEDAARAAHRVAFSTGRDLILAPPQTGEPLNYFVYPYAEVGGKAWPQDKIKTRFKFSDLPAAKSRPE